MLSSAILAVTEAMNGADTPGRGQDQALRSIAVLPFEDLSPAKDSEYLGAGVAEEIITDLSAIDALGSFTTRNPSMWA